MNGSDNGNGSSHDAATATKESYKILLGLPGPAPTSWLVAFSAFCAGDGRHAIRMENSGGTGDNFNALWMMALNGATKGLYTHFAMQHADVQAQPEWLGISVKEMDRLDADMISCAIPMKGTTRMSCGILVGEGRFPMVQTWSLDDIEQFPETWNAETAGYPGKILIHNNGLWVADLRKPVWRSKHPDGELKCYFDFRRRMYEKEDGTVDLQVFSEDFAFSQQIAEAGAKTYITKKVKLAHFGSFGYANYKGTNGGVVATEARPTQPDGAPVEITL